MRKTLFFALCVAMLFSYWACKNNGTGPVQSNLSMPSPYFPLAVGNWWELDDYNLDSNGVKVPGTEKMENDTITGTISFAGYNAYVLSSNRNEGPAYITF